MEKKIKNRFAETMLMEAKCSLISKGFPISISEEELKKMKYKVFEIASKEEIENLFIVNMENLIINPLDNQNNENKKETKSKN